MKQISDVDTTTSSSPALGPGVVIDRSVRPRDSRKDARPREGAARPVSLCASFWHTGKGPARALGAPGAASDGQAGACWIAPSCQAFGPTGRTKVQYSSKAVGAVRLPSTT